MRTRSRNSTTLISSHTHHTRPIRPRISYREPSSSEESNFSPDELQNGSPRLKRVQTKHSRRSSTSQECSSEKSSEGSSTAIIPDVTTKMKKGNVGKGARTNIKVLIKRDDEKVIPRWQTLPYEILLQIFHYAAQPLWDWWDRETDSISTPAISWLLKTALVCRSFTEPALSVLYYSPPLSPPSRARRLLTHLSSQHTNQMFNYRSKIKYLDIEIFSVLAREYGGVGQLDLPALLAYTPQLRGIGLHLLYDLPKYNPKYWRKPSKWEKLYRSEIFDTLDACKVSLLSWKWNFTLIGSHQHLSLQAVHSRPSFRNLSDLVLLGYSEKSTVKSPLLTDALHVLSKLKRVSLEFCSWSEDGFLQSLPHNIESLQIIGCPLITSKDLRIFLATHGSNLRDLVLNHNRSLNLAFVVELAASCPKLETLRMNLRYYTSYVTVADTEPKFEALLLPHEIPTWPSNLQILDLQYLRKWHSDTAESFFQSLVNSAATLPQLRRLTLKAIVNIDWRDRANFRGKWESRLKQVFLRHSPPPDPRFKSMQTLYTSEIASPEAQTCDGNTMRDRVEPDPSKPRSRRSSRITVAKKIVKDEETGDDDSSDIETVPKRRSTRLSNQNEDAYTCPGESTAKAHPQHRVHKRKRSSSASSSDDSSFEDRIGKDVKSPRKGKDKGLHIQGLCNVVSIQIDNLRPAEEQYHESDFLDAEKSGDEDWNGDDDHVSKWRGPGGRLRA